MNKLKIQDRDYDLWLTLNRTTYRITRARSRELRKYGLTPEQSGIIFFIRNSGNNAKPIDISRWMLRKPQTITSIIDRMVRKGLVVQYNYGSEINDISMSLVFHENAIPPPSGIYTLTCTLDTDFRRV